MATLMMGVILGLCWSVRIRFLIAESAVRNPGQRDAAPGRVGRRMSTAHASAWNRACRPRPVRTHATFGPWRLPGSIDPLTTFVGDFRGAKPMEARVC